MVKTVNFVWVDEAEELGYFKNNGMVLVMGEMQGRWRAKG